MENYDDALKDAKRCLALYGSAPELFRRRLDETASFKSLPALGKAIILDITDAELLK